MSSAVATARMSAETLPVTMRTGNLAYPERERSTKVPLQPSGVPASSTDPATWCSYEEAARTAAAWGPGFGVGFVLTAADDLGCIDIDSALQADSTWHPLALELCQSMRGAVVEVSQSGRGLHLWFRHASPPEHVKKRTVDGLRIECYVAERYILLGSSRSGTLADVCPDAPAVIARYFPPRETVPVHGDGPRPEWRGPDDDDELIRRALASRSAAAAFGDGVTFADLWHADADALGRRWPANGRPYDASSADAALAAHVAYWTGSDAERMDRLMRRSALMREKWDRPDYLPRTIAKACEMQREVYRERESRPAPAPASPTAAELWQPLDPEAIHQSRDLGITDPLSAVKHLIRERHQHHEGSLLRAWQGSFYRWGAAHWCELTEADVKADLYDFLDRQPGADYRPDQTRVNKVLDALRHASAVHLPSALTPPCWIGGTKSHPPEELVACANGLLHLPTRQLVSPTPRYFNLNAVPFDFNADAPQPSQWLAFLATIWPDDPDAIATLQELFGYLLTPDTSQQKIFLIVGPKRSGKGTIARVLTELLGQASVAGPTLESLGKDHGLQPLLGTLAAIVSDARLGGKADQKQIAEHLLRISGEDRVTVNRKFLPAITTRLSTRFVLLTNELPRIADASGAMASRFVILKMTQSFLGREDPGLTTRLLLELPGVLTWAVEGWHRLRARGYFAPPASSAAAVQELADLGSPITAFVRERCNLAPTAETGTDALYIEWRDWCASQGHSFVSDKGTFGRDLAAAFPQVEKGQRRSGRVYRGIAVSPRVTSDGALLVPRPPHAQQIPTAPSQ